MEYHKISTLPGEVIEHILSYLDISEVSFLANQIRNLSEKPTASLSNLTNQVLRYIAHCNICYTNRLSNYTILGLYILTPSYISKKDLDLVKSQESLLSMMRFCKWAGDQLTNEVTLTYYVKELSDLVDFRDVVYELGRDFQSMNFTFNIELEFDPAMLAVMDLSYIISMFKTSNFGRFITSMLITNYVPYCLIDYHDFPNLKRIWLVNSNLHAMDDSYLTQTKITDSFMCPDPFGNINNMSIVLKTGLPSTLTTLTLNHVTISREVLKYQYPSKLVKLDLESVKDLSHGKFFCGLLKANVNSKVLKDLRLQKLDGLTPENNQELHILIQKCCPVLNNLSVSPDQYPTTGSDVQSLVYLSNLKSIDISKPFVMTNFADVFKSLVSLRLENCDIDSLGELIFPPFLESLDLSYNPIEWSYPIAFPPRLTTLELRNTGLRKLNYLVLPRGLTILSLEVNLLTTIDDFKFPPRLRSLGIGSNRINKIQNHYLPPTLAILHLTENFVSNPVNFEVNARGEKLNIFSLYLNHNSIQDLTGFTFGSSLKVLNLDGNNISTLKNIDFKDLIELSVCGCNMNSIRNSKFGTSLSILNMGNNNLRTLPQGLPVSLKTLDLSFNEISTIDFDAFAHLSGVDRLSVSHNSLRQVKLRLHPNLRFVDFSCNKIVSFHLSYDKSLLTNNTTSLTSVNLSSNRLSKFSPDNLGITEVIQHNVLFEIDVSANKINSNQLDPNKFPPSMNALFVGYTGRQDAFGYDIAGNLINCEFCSGKKVET
ncbi:hypothetical protein PSN45_001964 [Yamadazyma tenuis]|uniref:L domain-like protein n=1 Tax=Candida tenuis (strain ATCC 10573 / BCRC 21748 / CBS 615 / JCM 9827 / NBRC 10315 / NRRL Y-1498 / VKM Y-70) TaxID=590646 RepID=G3BD99_CANTC|nr:L domain-like protein [Yamadazyma tenuis ATCC 10573]EGV60277.1 L domain-like protein [Yamadazyma tenuis ATCC 10573]WEJ94480.1 hypothetical protein PSN45_001964 [Yamadazyma tenuis]